MPALFMVNGSSTVMFVRSAVALAAVLVATPAMAEPLNAEAARHFVAGKLFAFTCFEGSTGVGRIFNDGSVAGVMKMRGTGSPRFMHLPAGTLFPKEDRICSHVKGAFFNPCFDLTKTSDKSFRGTVSGFGFAYCDFTRRGGGGRHSIQASIAPDVTSAIPRASIRHGRKHATRKAAAEKPATAPTTPVTAAPLEQTGMRSSITP
jgi:hypothetical protein